VVILFKLKSLNYHYCPCKPIGINPIPLKKSTKQLFLDHQRNAKELQEQGALPKRSIWLHNVRSMQNVGSIFRTADALAIDEVILSGYSPCPPRPEISKTALGAEELIPWRYIEDPLHEITTMSSKGIWMVALEQTTESEPLLSVKRPTTDWCLIAGSETVGLDDSILSVTHQTIHIDQYGQKHSFNVSVAVAIALHRLSFEV
jgi:tRNA G18 (ribose-2'-O)-methylase SpoU